MEQPTTPKDHTRNGERIVVYHLPGTTDDLRLIAKQTGQRGLAPLVRAAVAAYIAAHLPRAVQPGG